MSRDPDRLVLFTDAVVAIAVTLLVLPLVDVVPEVVHAHRRSAEVVTGHLPQLWAFALSFAVIIRLWFVHHRVFEHVGGYTRALMALNAGWLFAIVILPFPTEMVASYPGDDRFTVMLYIGNVLVATACQAALTVLSYRDPDVASKTDPAGIESVRSALSAVVLLALSLAVVAVFPGVSYFALLLLFLSTPVSGILRRAGV
ncbi:TMEM175 family protein [Actinomadura luteofluorescens]|uniref:TMEM175 family protein n=1 Tax=Actinomadura luteofluorescens TaxID=46163 RepID=UPI00216460FC|nr:TMEM175 family protein [Actinomadura glauciflava]